MVRDKKIQNALKRSEVHRKTKREKEQVKLKRRMEVSLARMTVGVPVVRPRKPRSYTTCTGRCPRPLCLDF